MNKTHTGAIIVAIATIVAAMIQTRSCGTTEKSSAEKVQVTTGAQSPIVTSKGDVNVIYGVPHVIVDRWTGILRARGFVDEEIQARLREVADASRKLQADLAERRSADADREVKQLKQEIATLGSNLESLTEARRLTGLDAPTGEYIAKNGDLIRKLRGVQQEMKLLNADSFTSQSERDKQLEHLRKRKVDLERWVEEAL